MSSEPVTIAVIGGSGWIGKRHCSHVVSCTGARLLAIVDPNPAASGIARTFGCKWLSNVDELLRLPQKPEGAIVCTPNFNHVAISTLLLRAGIHVLCEKPISDRAESADELIQELAVSKASLLVGHHRRFNPFVIEMKRVLDSGALGSITAVNGLWLVAKPDDYFQGQNVWRQDRSRGGGVTSINFIHDIDLMLYLFGPIKRLHAEKTISRRSTDANVAEEGFALSLRFVSGIVGTFIVADNVASPHNFEMGTGENPDIPYTGADTYRIFGTDGTLSFPDMSVSKYDGLITWLKPLTRRTVEVSDSDVPPFTRQLEHFIQVCKGEVAPSCSGQDATNALKVCEAIQIVLNNEDGGGTVNP